MDKIGEKKPTSQWHRYGKTVTRRDDCTSYLKNEKYRTSSVKLSGSGRLLWLLGQTPEGAILNTRPRLCFVGSLPSLLNSCIKNQWLPGGGALIRETVFLEATKSPRKVIKN